MASTDSQVRVKVYQLEDGSTWVDRGTGFCTLEDYQGVLHLNVASETQPNHLLLDCVVQRGEVYQQQDATLIVWTEPTGEDLALSFQEQEGCLMILNQISEFESATNEHGTDHNSPARGEVTLPQPTMSTLGEIERIIAEAGQSIYQRDKLVAFIVNEGYFAQLHGLHEACEDLDAAAELQTIYSITRRIILLNDSSIFECIIRDENILAVVAMLEYDPQCPVERGTYRNFLSDSSRYKEVVPIRDATMEAKIHQTFRLQYLKDVVLPRILDEGTLPIINALIFFNHAQIANYVQHNHAFLKELFDILHESDERNKKQSVVLFVRQFCALAKSLPVSYRVGLYRTLSQHGLFAIFEFSLQDDDLSLRMAGADVLISVLEQDRALVRSYVLAQIRQQRDGATLLGLIIQCTKRDIGSEIQTQCCEILRVILDTMPPPSDTFDLPPDIGIGGQTDRETEEFLALFYESYIFDTMEPLLNLTAKDIESINAHDKRAGLFLFLCELLSFLVKQHSYRARYFVFSSDISKRAALLLGAKPKYLKLAALRFIRSCVGLQDDVYNKYLIGHRLLDPIVDLFVSTHPRDNLITSACRELFKFVASYRISTLLAHFIGVHAAALERTPETLEHMRHAYGEYLEELEQERNGGTATPTVDTGRRSAVSINVLAGRDSAANGVVSPVPSTGANDGAAVNGLWKSAVTDEVEDAYFNDVEEAPDVLEPIQGVDSALADSRAKPDQDSGAAAQVVVCRTTGASTAAMDSGTTAPGRLQSIGSSGENRNQSNCTSSAPSLLPASNEHSGRNGASQSTTPFKPRNATNGVALNGSDTDQPKNDGSHADDRSFSGADGDASSDRANATTNGHMTISDAFPDSRQLVSRKLGAKPLLRRADAQSQIKINLHHQPQAGSNHKEQPALGKRQRPSGSAAKKLGLAGGMHMLGNSDGLSMDSGRSLAAKELLSDEIAGARLAVVTCSQSTPSIGLVGATSESQTPPKKAKTASS